MYRILIVDDEDFVVDSLSGLLESQADMELDVCRAYSASDALSWLNRAKIDIVISDIEMPKMNGIALAEKVKANWPKCRVLFLTAHAEFNYAYEAIRNNVVGYILKTASDDSILEEVKKAVAALDRELKNVELLGQVQKQLDDSMSVIRRELILEMVQGNFGDKSGLFKQLKETGADISPGESFILYAARIEDSKPGMDVVERFRILNSIEKINEQVFDFCFTCNCSDYFHNKMVFVMQLKGGFPQDAGDGAAFPIAGREAVFVGGMLETVQQSCLETLGVHLSFVLHGAPLGIEELAEAFRSVDRILNANASAEIDFVITDSAFPAPDAENTPAGEIFAGTTGMTDIAARLTRFLENGSREEYFSELEKIYGPLKKCTSWHDNDALEYYYSAAVAVISFINQRKLAGKIAFRIGLNGLFQPQYAGSWDKAAGYLANVSEILFQLRKEEEGAVSGNIILFLREYVSTHIAEDVSLIKLSEVTGYNATYLSRIFSEGTGKTLKNYINDEKMSLIVRLMKNKSLSLDDISSKSGFGYRTYFNKFVRKTTGMSPMEYRNHIQQG